MAVTVSVRSVHRVATEALKATRAFEHELPSDEAVRIEVSGVLAEQLAKELGAGARAGAVRVGGDAPAASADVLVRVIAGDPTPADESFVRASDVHGVPMVLVQLWPQEEWTRPFVLSPFVVECRAGEGFPLDEIGDRILDSTERGPSFTAGIPSLREVSRRRVVTRSVLRAAALGAFARNVPTRPLITLEQLRMAARLSSGAEKGDGAAISSERLPVAVVTGAVLGAGFALRGVARTTRFLLPPRVADAAVAAAGTWALAAAVKALTSRESS